MFCREGGDKPTKIDLMSNVKSRIRLCFSCNLIFLQNQCVKKISLVLWVQINNLLDYVYSVVGSARTLLTGTVCGKSMRGMWRKSAERGGVDELYHSFTSLGRDGGASY